jgi:Na+/proline symporter
LLVSRAGVVGFGLILAAIAWSCQRADNILWLAFRAVSVPAGSMLGVFLLGLLTKRGSNRGNIIAMTSNAVLMAALLLACSFGPVGLASFLGLSNRLPPPGEPALIGLAWSWLIVIGTGFTFMLAYVIGLIPVNKAARGLDYDEAF